MPLKYSMYTLNLVMSYITLTPCHFSMMYLCLHVQGFHQALESIDNTISRIHVEATSQGGMYSSSQKETLQ